MQQTTLFSALQCTRCGATYPTDHIGDKTCADDGYLVARYDLARGAQSATRVRASEKSLWRYASMLPVGNPDAVVSLGEGWTPLIHAGRAGARLGCRDLHIKDEGRNPSGTFKDRGASVAISRYRELGVRSVILHSSGNAGAAWSLYAARAGFQCVAILPSDVSDASLAQCTAAGGRTHVCEDWHQAGNVASDLARRNGWVNVGTLKEPYRIEGKKTMGYEIAEQLGWSLPNAVFYPIGGGTGAIAIWKAFAEMRALRWVDDRPVRLFVSQYEGCAPIVKAFEENRTECSAWGRIDIPPGGLKSPNPPGGRDVLALIRESGGAALSVSADEARRAARDLAQSEGLFVGLEAATTFAALTKALERGLLARSDRIVLVATGSGLKSVASLDVERPTGIRTAEDTAMI